MTEPTPIHRFLGEVRLGLGPFGLLGLPVGPCDAARIESALKRQLGRIDRHPQGSSPDAEEVRLALHVASAQLKDRAVQEEVLADLAWRPPAPPAPAPTGPARVAPAPAPSGLPALARAAAQAVGAPVRATTPAGGDRRAFERMALWVLADAGGWNRAAQRRIAAIAHAWSLSTDELTSSLRALSSGDAVRAVRVPSAPGMAAPRPIDGPVSDAEPSRLPARALVRRWGLLALLVVMVLSSVALIRAAFDLNWARRRAAEADGQRGGSFEELGTALPGPGTDKGPEPQPVVRDVALSRPPEARAPSGAAAPVRGGLEPASDPNTIEWAVFARAQLERTAPAGAPLAEVLRDAARFAIVNAGAARLQGSEPRATEDARRLITTLSEDSALARTEGESPLSLSRLTSPAIPPDGTLALELIRNKRNAAAAVDALKNLRVGRETLGPADCDAVAEIALFSAGAELRGAARLVVMDEGRNTAMLEAILDQLARNPPAAPASELIQELTRRALPPVSDASWPTRARAAVLERLAEEIGAERDAELDDLAESLAGAYEATAEALAPGGKGAAAAPGSRDAASAEQRPDDAAARVFDLWRRRAEVFRSDATIDQRVDDLLARRQQRLMLASGPIQRCVAEQGSIVEMMGLVVSAERPSQASRVERLIQEFGRERRDSPHAMAQIRSGERAVARLWLAMMNQPDLGVIRRDGP